MPSPSLRPASIRPLSVLTAAGLLAAAGIALWPHLAQTNAVTEWHAAAVVLAGLSLWATGRIPEAATAIAFFAAAILLKVAPAEEIFSGFTSKAFWLVFGGLLMGIAVKRSGLGERIAHTLVGRVGTSWLALCWGIAGIGMLLAFIMPSSMGRVMLMLPVVMGLADRLGYAPDSKGRTGMALMTGMMGLGPAVGILPAVVPNNVMTGAAERLYGLSFDYFSWLLAAFPTLGILKCLLIVGVTWKMFAEEPPRQSQEVPPGPMSGEEKRLSILLCATLLLWLTDRWHGISPAWISLAGGAACLLPPRPLVPMAAFNEKMSHGSLYYIAGLMGLGAVLASSGLGDRLGSGLLSLMPLSPETPLLSWLSQVILTTVIAVGATVPGTPAIMTPLAQAISDASGTLLTMTLMTQAVGYSSIVLPYQVPPLILAMQLGGVRMRPAARYTLVLLLLTVGLVWPSTYVWWKVLGLLP